MTLPVGASLSNVVEISPDGTKILGSYDNGAFTPQNAFIAEIPAQPSWEQYGVGASPSNILDLDGGGSTSTGGTFMPTTSLIPVVSTFTATGISLADASVSAFGGVVLINPVPPNFITSVPGSPAGTGSVTHNIPIPATASLFGTTVYFQSLCDDPAQPAGLAFSNGLSMTICL